MRVSVDVLLSPGSNLSSASIGRGGLRKTVSPLPSSFLSAVRAIITKALSGPCED